MKGTTNTCINSHCSRQSLRSNLVILSCDLQIQWERGTAIPESDRPLWCGSVHLGQWIVNGAMAEFQVDWNGLSGGAFWLVLVSLVFYVVGMATIGWAVNTTTSFHVGLWDACQCNMMRTSPGECVTRGLHLTSDPGTLRGSGLLHGSVGR